MGRHGGYRAVCASGTPRERVLRVVLLASVASLEQAPAWLVERMGQGVVQERVVVVSLGVATLVVVLMVRVAARELRAALVAVAGVAVLGRLVAVVMAVVTVVAIVGRVGALMVSRHG